MTALAPSLHLTPSQETALRFMLESEENIFLTGGPGTGKSFLIAEYLKVRKEKIPVIASTGAAALLVGGRTFHSFFNLGIMQGGPQAVFERALENSRLRKRLGSVATVVIDEISMLSAETLDCAERISRELRDGRKPWGGLRVIAVGDFAQLPPITRNRQKEWAFLGQAWERSKFKKFVLSEVKRTQDQDFLKILEQIRWGNISGEVEEFLNSRMISPEELEADVPHVFPRRAQTDAFNRARLAEIPHPVKIYETEYGGKEPYVERLMNDAPIVRSLELKMGALVMLRINDPKGRYINGSVGTVVEMGEETLEIETRSRRVELERFTFTLLDGDGEIMAYARNFPVSLAYASTIHKIQGTTLERVHVSLKALWEPGQAYVALSRVRNQKDLTLSGWDPYSIIADETVRRFYEVPEPAREDALSE